MTEPKTSMVPASAVSQAAALLSLLGMLLAVGIFRGLDLRNSALCFVVMVIFMAVPHVWPFRKSIGNAARIESDDRSLRERLVVKFIGLVAVYCLIAISYFLFEGFYQSFVRPLKSLWSMLWLPVLIISPIYIFLADRNMVQPEDGLYHLGKVVTGRRRGTDWGLVKQYLLGWLVKGFFAPLMIGFILRDIEWALSFDVAQGLRNPVDYYSFAYRLSYFVDVAFAATGYLCTFRLFDTQIRTTEPTMFGWVVCIMCYAPFWSMFRANFLEYEEGYYWGHWLASNSLLWICWAILITGCLVIYSWSTVSFGIRFSNLTNRGILTNGPYRWMKHPSYVSKNVSWWLISIPFLSDGTVQGALRNCLLLLCVNVIYYLRAKTEERHLMSDPSYVEYSAWMEKNSLYAKITRKLGVRASA